jgi:hypothetical protein
MLINAELHACWGNMPPNGPISPALLAAVSDAVREELPREVRDRWATLTVTADEAGHVNPIEVIALLTAEIGWLNTVRHEQAGTAEDPPDFALASPDALACLYTWVDEQRVCYYNHGLTLGGEKWEIDDPDDITPDAVMELQISWRHKEA